MLKVYADVFLQLKIVAICDPRKRIRCFFEKEYGVPTEFQFQGKSIWLSVVNIRSVLGLKC